MKSLALILVVIGSSILLAEAFTPDVHDPTYRKTTSFIEKGDYLDAPQQGTSGVHKHSDKAPHHDDSHSHEDSSEHRRHAREAGDGVDVESRRLGSGSHSHGSRPGSGLGSGSLHSGHGSSGLGHSSGLGSGSLHTGSSLGHGSSGHHGSSGLGSGSHHSGSGLGSGLGSGHHGSSGLGSGSHHSGSGLGSGHHGSSGLGSGSHHSGSGYQGSSGHSRRPSSVRGGTISFNDGDHVIMEKRATDTTSPAGSTISVEGNTVRLTNAEHSCLYSNVRDEIIGNRGLECNGESCSLLEESERHTAWKCGLFKCNILKFNINEPLPSGLVFQCTEERSLINAPKRCPAGSKVDWAGKCRAEF